MNLNLHTPKLRNVAVLVLALAFTASFAQDPGQGQGEGRQRREGRRQGGMMNRGGFGLTGLLQRTDVQADLQLTDEQKSKIGELRRSGRGEGRGEGRRNRRGGGDAPAGGAPNGENRPNREEMRARREAEQKQLETILTPAQTKRLHEIQIQLQGGMAVLNPEVQPTLNLTEAQKTRARELRERYQEAMRSVFEKVQGGSLERTQAREAMEKNSKVLGEELLKVLTPAQANQLKTLSGTPFTATEQTRRRG
jgi:Spy/CpxP family protein refolding chaperone